MSVIVSLQPGCFFQNKITWINKPPSKKVQDFAKSQPKTHSKTKNKQTNKQTNKLQQTVIHLFFRFLSSPTKNGRTQPRIPKSGHFFWISFGPGASQVQTSMGYAATVIPLMVLKSGINSPVEVGSGNPIIYKVLYLPGGAGFLNHQPYFFSFKKKGP